MLLTTVMFSGRGTGKLIYHRQYLLDIVQNYVEDWVSQYLPKTPEPPSSVPKGTMYISHEARLAVKRARATGPAAGGAAVPVDAAAVGEWDGEVDVGQVRGSPRGGTHGASVDDDGVETPVRASPRRQQLCRGDVDELDDDTIRLLDSATVRTLVRTDRLHSVQSA